MRKALENYDGLRPSGDSLRRAGERVKGAILFHKREWPPFDPPRERFRLAVWGLNHLFPSGMGMPARGFAALGVAIRFVSLLLSAAALPIL